MTIYRAPQRDMRFVLHELLEVEQLARCRATRRRPPIWSTR